MSLSLITDTAAEIHRLAIAGSALAAGDFRLNKLVPQLEALGAKAPIFTRIAQGVKAVTEEPDAAKAGRALLDLSTLLTAIQYTQSPHGADGDFIPINTGVQSWTPTVAGYRSLAAVVESLTSSGEGRLQVVRDACERGLFKDLRLMQPAVGALSDRFGELADYVAEHAIPQFGPVVVPLLKAGFDPKGGNAHARRLTALCRVNNEEGRAFCRAALEDARKEVRVAAVAGMAGSIEDYETILKLTKDRAQEVRHAAIHALGKTHGQEAAADLQSLFDGPEGEVAFAAAVAGCSGALPERVITYAKTLLAPGPSGIEGVRWKQRRWQMLLAALRECRGRQFEGLDSLLLLLFEARNDQNWELNGAVAQLLYEMNSARHDELLYSAPEGLGQGQHVCAFMAAYRRVSPAELWRMFGTILEKRGVKSELHNLLAGFPVHLSLGAEYPAWGDNLELDPAWLKLAVKLEWMPVVANLTRKGDLEAKELLIRKERHFGNDGALHYKIRCAIFRADPDKASHYLRSCLDAIRKRAAPYEIQYLLRQLAAAIPVDVQSVTEIGQSLAGQYKEVFDAALAEICHNASRT